LLVAGYPHKLIGPELLELERGPIASHTQEYHRTGLIILDQLSKALRLPEIENLTNAHEPQTPTTSSMTFLKYVDHGSQMNGGHVSHTDIGTLTFLYALIDGLQIFHPTENSWLWVEPRQNSLVVNVGDSLALLTNKSLKSSLHRVIPHPNAQGKTRFSFAYFMRPNETVSIEMADGQMWNSKDWYLKKASLFAAPLAVQTEYSNVLQGRI
jgi:isopenicillin N synthase-like dioxygenase